MPRMEIVGATENPKQHKWLRWVGLQEPPLDADSWVPVVRGLRVSDEQSGRSKLGGRLIKLLSDAGIHAEQQSYQFADDGYMAGSVTGIDVLGGHAVHRIAVMVHQRDEQRAIEIATELNKTLVQEARLERAALDADVEREATDSARRPPSG